MGSVMIIILIVIFMYNFGLYLDNNILKIKGFVICKIQKLFLINYLLSFYFFEVYYSLVYFNIFKERKG